MRPRFTVNLELEVDGADHLDAARTAEAVISDPLRDLPFYWTVTDNQTGVKKTLQAPGDDSWLPESNK